VTTRSLCGFEAGDSLEVRSLNGTGSIQTSIVRTGTYAGRTNPTTTATGNFRIGQTGLSTGDGRTINELGGSNEYIRVYGYIATAPGSGDEEFFTLWDNAATAAMKIAVRLNSSRQLVIYDSANALQATGATALSLTTWYRFELRASTGAGSTAYELKIDGNVELSGSCAQLTTAPGSVRLGKNTDRSGQSVDYYWDDFIVDDTAYPGAGQIKVLLPTANGVTAQWTSGTGASDYTQVNVIPDNTGTYLQKSAAASQTHYCTMATCASASISGTINAVRIYTTQMESGSVTSSLRAICRGSTGSTVLTTGFNGSTTITGINLLRNVEPGTSAALTTSVVDGMQYGVNDSGTATAVRATAIYLMVDYTPAAAAPTVKSLAATGVG
jgi:hypothetical protein